MTGETLALLALGLGLLLAFWALFRLRERLEWAEERLADARMRMWTFAEAVRDAGDEALARRLEIVFPEIIQRVTNPRDRKDVNA